MIITIDGPVASGKSSLARAIANKLNIYYLNSGLLYRAVAYVNLKNPNLKFEEIIKDLHYSYDQKESIKYKNEDITAFLKTPEIDKATSILSETPDLRLLLLDYQRNFDNNLITDGRDCGSVVFPNADVKIFLTASIEVRAKRWQHDMQLKGKNFTIQEAQKTISDRDKRDQERLISPLIIPKDAIVLDNSNLTQQETLDKILEIIT